jgi:predicted lipoprotein with Yx(FWY)xxD motif
MTRTLAPPRTQPGQVILRVAGAGLLAATGAIHLDLYLTGYRTIPTIGWLFLLQVIAAFGLAVAVLVTGSRLAAAAGAGFAVATLAGYLLSIWVGLFGFTEVRTTAGIVAGIIEVAAFAVLAFMTVAPAAGRRAQAGPLDRLVAAIPAAGALIAGVSVVALVLLGVAAGTAGSSSTVASGNSLKAVQVGGVSVLANAKGFTLYWFAPDTATKSVCNGSCAAYWPPVKGPATAGPGIPGKLGTIKRADGSTQATYDGHPLYTYVGDSAPGQARGNNLNLNGGLWHEVTTSG